MIKPVWMQSGETLQTKFGPFRHDDIIGQRFGTQLPSLTGRGFVHVIKPTPELWALSLPHRTQIVYSPDASYIVHRLAIRPGAKVIEAGTGSAAFTHALARTVYTLDGDGYVFTYEYHEDRFNQAREEFKAHKLDNVVHPTRRNVCEEGFKIDVPTLATAVFLDLPAPWLAIPFLLKDGCLDRTKVVSICCFSPCIEQVAKTVEVLTLHGFRSIEMVENQARRWEGHNTMIRTVDEALDILRDVRRRRDLGLNRRKRKREVQEIPEEKWSEEEVQLMRGDFDNPEVYNPWGRSTRVREGDTGFNWQPTSWSETEIKSHTSYLTFAQLPPAVLTHDEELAKQQ